MNSGQLGHIGNKPADLLEIQDKAAQLPRGENDVRNGPHFIILTQRKMKGKCRKTPRKCSSKEAMYYTDRVAQMAIKLSVISSNLSRLKAPVSSDFKVKYFTVKRIDVRVRKRFHTPTHTHKKITLTLTSMGLTGVDGKG